MPAPNRKRGRAVHGIVLVDKPGGMTSNRLLQRVKRLYGAAKAGHTGSLDPMATGMLPVCLGVATRVSGLLLAARKSYRVEVELGAATDTGDADGTVTEQRQGTIPDREELAAVVEAMLGDSEQIPPMFSALKHRGQRLYAIARRGEEVPRPPRPITIHAIELGDYDWPRFTFAVTCSKGTYIRSLAIDIAAKLDNVAHVTHLRRVAVGPFSEAQMVSLETLEQDANRGEQALDRHLLGVDAALPDLPGLELGADQATALVHGQSVELAGHPEQGAVKVYGAAGEFVGIAELDAAGLLKPKKIFLAL